MIRVKNGYLASHREVDVPYSKEKEGTLKVLKESGFIKDFQMAEEDGKKNLKVELLDTGVRSILDVKRVSKPGRRIYIRAKEIYSVKGGSGVLLVSTSKGIMTGSEAKKKNLGGELIAEVF